MHTILTPSNKCVKPKYLQFDNLDDRREIYTLLTKLSPLRRIAYMDWYYSNIHLGPWLSIVPAVSPETRRLAHEAMNDDAKDELLSKELFGDIWQSSCYSGLSLDLALAGLVRTVKKKPR